METEGLLWVISIVLCLVLAMILGILFRLERAELKINQILKEKGTDNGN